MRLLLKGALFGLPYAALLGFPAWQLHRAGELADIDALIAEQAAGGGRTLLGLAYTNPDKYYKVRAAAAREPRLLVLGASRIMQVRGEFFRPDAGFYNAGGGVEKIRHLRAFLERIPEDKTPKHILLSLEQCFFNPAWDNLKPDGVAAQYSRTPEAGEILAGSFLDFYRDLLQGKFGLDRIAANAASPVPRLGLNAVMNENGFRADGSYHAGAHLNDPDNPAHPDHHFKATLARIASGTERFEPFREVSAPAVEELRAFLAECIRRNIRVTGVFPPFAPTVRAKLASEGARYPALLGLGAALQPLFAERGLVFKDYSDMAPLGAADAEFFDGFHGSEKVMLRLLVDLLDADPALAAYADPAALRARLEASRDRRYAVF